MSVTENHREVADSPAASEQAMLLTMRLLEQIRAKQTGIAVLQDWRDLLRLRDEYRDEVNQGTRAILNLFFLEADQHSRLLNEIIRYLREYANRKLFASAEGIDDAVQQGYCKWYAKKRELDIALQNAKHQALAAAQPPKQASGVGLCPAGIFNPLLGDFLTWFSRLVQNIIRSQYKKSKKLTVITDGSVSQFNGSYDQISRHICLAHTKKQVLKALLALNMLARLPDPRVLDELDDIRHHACDATVTSKAEELYRDRGGN